MGYFLRKQRDQDVAGSFRRYQEYLRTHQQRFPPGAFALGTAEWYYNANDHRCPHDAWLESFTICEAHSTSERATSIRIRLVGAYHDGYIELFYPCAFRYMLEGFTTSKRGVGDWLYDEFRLSPEGHLVHEIEWWFPKREDSRWIIEASDVEFRWIPQISLSAH
jgi:hypothetical protein